MMSGASSKIKGGHIVATKKLPHIGEAYNTNIYATHFAARIPGSSPP